MIEQKINHAKFCLEYYPDMKIIQIATDLGFYDEYHFSRQFKKETGLSPKHFREHIRSFKNEQNMDIAPRKSRNIGK
jgi:AraC-like DNA-binding protein